MRPAEPGADKDVDHLEAEGKCLGFRFLDGMILGLDLPGFLGSFG